MATVFISHAGADSAVAATVRSWLREDGHEVFLDRDVEDGILLGDDWAGRLQERLRWADAMVCLVSAGYTTSAWCTAEVAIALSRRSTILPLAVEAGAVHPLLSGRQHLPFDPDPAGHRSPVSPRSPPVTTSPSSDATARLPHCAPGCAPTGMPTPR